MKIKALSLIALSLIFTAKSGLQAKQVLELKLSLPHESQGIFFKTIPFLALDTRQAIYAVDNRSHEIYKFNLNEEKVIRIGRPGQGPGELQQPFLIQAESGKVYVIDNLGVSIFEDEGTFINRFRIFRGPISFAVRNNIIYVIEAGGKELVVAYDHRGNRLRSFGTKCKVNYGFYPGWPEPFVDKILNEGKALLVGNRLFYVTYLFADLFEFDPEGRLKSRRILLDREEAKANKKFYFEKGQKNEGKGFLSYSLFLDMDYLEGRFYLLLNSAVVTESIGDILEIEEKSLRMTRAFWLENKRTAQKRAGFDLRSLRVMQDDDNGKLRFVVSLYDEKLADFRINIYEGGTIQ